MMSSDEAVVRVRRGLVAGLGLGAWLAVPAAGQSVCGTEFEKQPTPNPAFAEVNRLHNVDVVSAEEMWAVGLARDVPPPPNGSTDSPLAMRYDGESWSITDLPVEASPGSLDDVHAISADEVYACGGGAQIGDSSVWIFRWDGSSWEAMFDPSFVVPTDPAVVMHSVDALDGENVWFAGGGEIGGGLQKGTLYHYDGSDFTRYTTPVVSNSAHRLRAVSVLSPDEVWAAGAHGGVAVAVGRNYVVRFDGETWEHVPTPELGEHELLRDIVAIASDDVWAVGSYDFGEPLMLHWDGAGWTVHESPMVVNDLVAIASDDIYGVNDSRVAHWDGASWSVVAEYDGPMPAFDGIERVGDCDFVISGWEDGAGPGEDDSLIVRFGGGCAADVNGDGSLDVLDFVAFQNLFTDGDPAADCDGSGSLNVLDFLCFQGVFAAGCE